jgi:hypothetical protein
MSGLSASVLFQEFQERIVYVFGALLLSPMTATFQDYCLAKQGHELFQARDEMVPIRRSVNPVSITNDIECRDLNLCARPWCEQFPIPINVAIPIQTSSKAGALELLDVKFDVIVREPRRQ